MKSDDKHYRYKAAFLSAAAAVLLGATGVACMQEPDRVRAEFRECGKNAVAWVSSYIKSIGEFSEAVWALKMKKATPAAPNP